MNRLVAKREKYGSFPSRQEGASVLGARAGKLDRRGNTDRLKMIRLRLGFVRGAPKRNKLLHVALK
eukprot:4787603-Pyramimonas_sp.AAC.1